MIALAESIKLSSARLNQLWFNEVTDTARHIDRRRSPPAPGGGQSRRSERPRDGGGGKGLVTKAVKLVVHFPQIAARISGAQLTQLEMADDAGARFLFELIDQLQQEPPRHTRRSCSSAGATGPRCARMRALAGEEMLGSRRLRRGARADRRLLKSSSLEPTLRRYDELMRKPS